MADKNQRGGLRFRRKCWNHRRNRASEVDGILAMSGGIVEGLRNGWEEKPDEGVTVEMGTEVAVDLKVVVNTDATFRKFKQVVKTWKGHHQHDRAEGGK